MFTIAKSYIESGNVQDTMTMSPQFMQQLKTKWDEIHSLPDVFRYKINNLRERKVGNKYILLLNVDRGFKRRTPESIHNIRQAFDHNKFNFNKALSKEVLFKLQDTGGADTHTFFVNVSPITRYHMLLCPSINKCLPQILTEGSMKLVLDLKFSAQDCDLKIAFNGLCAFASVNHLHYHLVFEKNNLYVETVKCTNLKGSLYIIQDYPVPAFCLEVTEETIPQATKDIYRLIEYLLSKSIAHNVLVTSGEALVPGCLKHEVVRVLVTPRLSTAGIKQLTSFNVAAFELSGWFPVFNSEQFDDLSESDLENELRKWKLPNFEALCKELKLIY